MKIPVIEKYSVKYSDWPFWHLQPCLAHVFLIIV